VCQDEDSEKELDSEVSIELLVVEHLLSDLERVLVGVFDLSAWLAHQIVAVLAVVEADDSDAGV